MVVNIGICRCCATATLASLHPQLVLVTISCQVSRALDPDITKLPSAFGIADAQSLLSGVIMCQHLASLPSEDTAVQASLPSYLPTITVDELPDPALKNNFWRRVFACYDYQRSMAAGFSRRALVAFHSRYKFLVMAHGTVSYRQLGRLVGECAQFTSNELQWQYLAELLSAMQRLENRRQHTNTLQHLQGFLKTKLTADERQTLTALIEQYRCDTVSLDKPMQLLQHYLTKYPHTYLAQQAYFSLYANPIRIPD